MARKTGLRGLQEWAKHVTQGYRDVEVTNMTTAFKSGLAFCAIIHRYHPELIPYDELRKENVLANNQLAFSVADNELDIPALLDAEDMVSLAVPDKLSIATYLSLYYNYFKDKTPAKAGSVGVKTAATNEVAPSPKRSKVEPIKKAMSSPSLKGKENTPFKSNPSSLTNPSTVQTSPTKAVETHKGRRSKFNKSNDSEGGGTLKRGTMGKEECQVCGERVFLLERLGVENRVFHRSCFKCSTCLVALKPGSYELHSETNKFYCQQHYRETVRQATIKRTMAERGLSPTTEAPIKPKRSKKYKTKPSASTEIPPKQSEEKSVSSEVRVGLPSLLKTLAANKQQREANTASVVPPKQATASVVPPKQATASVVPPKQTVVAKIQQSPTKPPPPITNVPARPQPPVVSTSKTNSEALPKPSQTIVTTRKLPITAAPDVKLTPSNTPTKTVPSAKTPQTTPVEPVKNTVDPEKKTPINKKTPVEPVKKTPVDPIKKTPVEPVKKTPVDPIKKTPVEPVKKTPVDPIKKTPVEPVKKTPVDPIKKAVEPVKKTPVVDPIKKTVEPVEKTPVVDPIKKTVEPVKKTPVDPIKKAVEPVKKTPVDPVKKAIEPVKKTPVVDPIKKAVEPVKKTPVVDPIKKAIEPVKKTPVVDPIKKAVEPVKKTPVDPVKKTVEPVKKTPVVDPIKKAVEPVKKTPVDPVKKTVEPVKKTPVVDPIKKAVEPVKKTPVDPVKKTVEPVKKTPVVDPIKKAVEPVKKTPVDPVKKTVEPVKKTPVVVGSGEPVVPVKPPRKKRDDDAPVKRGSIKPKRPAPPRPANPPTRQEQVRGGELLVEKRRRRVATLKRELDHVEREQERLEERGVALEQQLRQKEEEADDTLMEEWFGLVNDKSLLVRTESDLVYELKDLELVEQHEALDIEIRRRLAKNESLKSEVERLEEEAMISELVELVEKRDKLLWTLHFEKTQDDESDRQVELMTSTQVVQPSKKLNKSMSFM